MSVGPLPSGKFRVQIRHQGHPRFDAVFPTLEAARAAEAAELARRAQVAPLGVRMSFTAAAAEYLDSDMYLSKKPNTRRAERQLLVPAVAAIGIHTLEHLASNKSVFVKYKKERLRTTNPKTGKLVTEQKLRVELCAMSSVFLWAMENGYLLTNPLAGIPRGKSAQTSRRLLPSESTHLKLLAERGSNEDDRQIARFLLIQLELVCRPGELAEVLLSDIDLHERDVTFRDTKNGTDRLAHIPVPAVDLIAEQQVYAAAHGGPYLFSTMSRKGEREYVKYNYSWQIRRFKKLGYLAKDFFAHCIRSEGITRGFESGVSPTIMLKMSGHKSLISLERYKKKVSISNEARDVIDEHATKMQLEADAHVNNQLPPKFTLARAQHQFAALPPEIQEQFKASLLSSTLPSK